MDNMLSEEQRIDLEKEFVYRTSRSGGSGGQHVNKVSSKVELIWNLKDSKCLDEDQKIRLKYNLRHRLLQDGSIRIVSQKGRSQLQNKAEAIIRFLDLLNDALQIQRPRKATKIPKAVLKKRREDKVLKAFKKLSRKKIDPKSF